MSAVIVWSKPACQQCRMVKFRLEAAGVPFEERDLTAPEAAKDLEHFRGLGYSSAPITEFGGIAVPGFMPSEIDRVIEAWRAEQAQRVIVKASFEGQCGDCGAAIIPGQEIELDDATRRWSHVTCPPAKFDITRELCPQCFTEKAVNGECMCEATP